MEVISGPLKFVDSESLTVSTTALALTSAAYAKTTTGANETANIAYISTLDNPIFISFTNSEHSTPGSADEGIYWTAAMGPFVCHPDALSKVRLLRAGGTDADVNVNYFIG